MYARFAHRIKILQNINIKQTLYAVRIPKQITHTTYASLITNRENKFVFLKINSNRDIAVAYSTGTIETKSKNIRPKKAKNSTKLNNLIDRLEGFYQLNGYLCEEHLQSLINHVKQTTCNCLTSEFLLFLLIASGCEMPTVRSQERLLYFQEIWLYLQQRQLLSKDHYMAMLQVLQHNQAPVKDYQNFLKEFGHVGGNRNEIFSKLLSVAGHNGNVKLATELLTEMRSLQLSLNEHDFNSLLMAYGRAKDLNGCQTVLNSMQAAGVISTTKTQSTLVTIYLENNANEKALSIIKRYCTQFETSDVLKMWHALVQCPNVTPELIKTLIKAFKEDYFVGLEVPKPLRRLCIELLHNDKLDLVCCIMENLPQTKFTENQDIDTYGVFLLNALFRNNSDIEKVIRVAMQLVLNGKNTRALYVAAELALKHSPHNALAIFEMLKKRQEKIKPHYFWPLLIHNFQHNGEAGILHTLKIMCNFNVEYDTDTLWNYVLPKLSLTISNPQLVLQKFLEAGIKTSVVLVPLIVHLLNQSKWLDVAPLVEKYPIKINVMELVNYLCATAVHARATKRYYQYAKLLAVLSAKAVDRKQDFVGYLLIEVLNTQVRFRGDHYACSQLLSDMQKFGLTISTAAACILQKIFQERDDPSENAPKKFELLSSIQKKLKEISVNDLILPYESILRYNFQEITKNEGTHTLVISSAASTASTASTSNPAPTSFIKHPRDMSLKELECHLIELEAKGMNTRGVLRRLLQLCVRENHLERALEVKKKCEELNVQISPGMFASFVEMYVKLKDLPKAEENLTKLQQTYPGFLIDEHKFVDYAALLINCQQLEKAKKVLRERSQNNRIAGGNYLLKNVWNLLTNVAYLAANTKTLDSNRNLTHEMFVFLQQLGYCQSHNTILGPIIRERLLRHDLSGAVMEFKQLAERYKHTPLQFELLSLLVRLCNNDENAVKEYNCSKENAQHLLSNVTNVISTVHGSINMNTGLLLAFAESGTENQLRRLLINPEFCINEALLIRNCDHLNQEGSVQTLLRLGRSCRGLNRAINVQNIYAKLLNNFVKTNDCTAALNLYQQLEDDEMQIPSDFIRNLVCLLKVNNLEVPSNITLRAQVLQQ